MKKSYIKAEIKFTCFNETFDLCTSDAGSMVGPVYVTHGNDNCGTDPW